MSIFQKYDDAVAMQLTIQSRSALKHLPASDAPTIRLQKKQSSPPTQKTAYDNCIAVLSNAAENASSALVKLALMHCKHDLHASVCNLISAFALRLSVTVLPWCVDAPCARVIHLDLDESLPG